MPHLDFIRRRRAFFFLWQHGRCYLCGGMMNKYTDDHVLPKSDGGRRAYNVALAHEDCNTERGVRPLGACHRFFAQEAWKAWHVFTGDGEPPFGVVPVLPERAHLFVTAGLGHQYRVPKCVDLEKLAAELEAEFG